MVSFDGGSASKVDDVTALPSRHKMADMCYYGNVMTTTRWWLRVTMFYIFNSTVIDWTCFYFSCHSCWVSNARPWYLSCFPVIVACRLWVNGIAILAKAAFLFFLSTSVTLQLKYDGTRWRTGREMKGKLANRVGSQYSSHYLGTWCIQHYYRWCAQLGCQQLTELTPPPI